MQAWRLWEDTALEEALGQLFSPWLQRVKPSSDPQYGVVTVVTDDAQRRALRAAVTPVPSSAQQWDLSAILGRRTPGLTGSQCRRNTAGRLARRPNVSAA